MPNKERKIKILPKHFSRRWKDAIFPEIRLAGKWLQDMGFTCGRFVTISQDEETIIIKMLPAVEVQPAREEKKRKQESFLPPELEHVPGNQLFRVWAAEDYNAYVAKVKEAKKKKKARKEVAKVVPLEGDHQALPINRVADSETPIVPLHPAADGCNFDTIA